MAFKSKRDKEKTTTREFFCEGSAWKNAENAIKREQTKESINKNYKNDVHKSQHTIYVHNWHIKLSSCSQKCKNPLVLMVRWHIIRQ